MPLLPRAFGGVGSRDERKMLDWKSSAKNTAALKLPRIDCKALISRQIA
jgi:hypothetical protein